MMMMNGCEHSHALRCLLASFTFVTVHTSLDRQTVCPSAATQPAELPSKGAVATAAAPTREFQVTVAGQGCCALPPTQGHSHRHKGTRFEGHTGAPLVRTRVPAGKRAQRQLPYIAARRAVRRTWLPKSRASDARLLALTLARSSRTGRGSWASDTRACGPALAAEPCSERCAAAAAACESLCMGSRASSCSQLPPR